MIAETREEVDRKTRCRTIGSGISRGRGELEDWADIGKPLNSLK